MAGAAPGRSTPPAGDRCPGKPRGANDPGFPRSGGGRSAAARRPPTILIIDDDPAMRETLAATLSVEGFDVVVATDGDEGADLAGTARPSLILLDMEVADARGLALFHRINARLPSVPIIMVTARDDELDAVLALEAGAADHITKPPRPRELTARIRAVLRRMDGPAAGRSSHPRSSASSPTVRSASIHRSARLPSAAARSSSPAKSSTCWLSSPRRPAMWSHANSAWTASGATERWVTAARSTPT